MKKKIFNNKVVIYQAKSGAIELRGDSGKDTIWATLDQIAAVFGRDKSVISRHIKNIFNEGELSKSSVVAKNATTAADGKVYQYEDNVLREDGTGRFRSRDEVMGLFFKSHFDGKLLDIARLVEKSFGKGAFRTIGMMNDEEKSARLVMDYLMKQRRRK